MIQFVALGFVFRSIIIIGVTIGIAWTITKIPTKSHHFNPNIDYDTSDFDYGLRGED